jgi:hypothetical protein
MQKFIRVLTGLAICASASAYAMGEYAPAYFKPGFVLGVDGGYGFLNTPDKMYPGDFTLVNPMPNGGNVWNLVLDQHQNIGSFIWGVHAGYDFQTGTNSLVGLELGYKDLGRSKYEVEGTYHNDVNAIDMYPLVNATISQKMDEQALNLLLTYHYYVYQGFNVFAKAGVADVYASQHQNIDVAITGRINEKQLQTLTFNGSMLGLDGCNHVWRFEPDMQIGAGYTFAQHVNVYAYYEHIGDNAPSIWDHLSQAKAYAINSVWAGVSYTF